MRNTCAGCPHLVQHKIAMNGIVSACGKTEMVIPHQSERKGQNFHMTYWRIPLSCPLPDSEVLKSETKAPQRQWVVELVPA